MPYLTLEYYRNEEGYLYEIICSNYQYELAIVNDEISQDEIKQKIKQIEEA